jgi:hypothetical protein
VSALTFIALFLLELLGLHGGPYVGILGFIVIPTLFVIGCCSSRSACADRRRRESKAPPDRAVIDLSQPDHGAKHPHLPRRHRHQHR